MQHRSDGRHSGEAVVSPFRAEAWAAYSAARRAPEVQRVDIPRYFRAIWLLVAGLVAMAGLLLQGVVPRSSSGTLVEYARVSADSIRLTLDVKRTDLASPIRVGVLTSVRQRTMPLDVTGRIVAVSAHAMDPALMRVTIAARLPDPFARTTRDSAWQGQRSRWQVDLMLGS